MILKTLEAVVPEALVMREPVAHRAESFRDETVTALATMTLLGDETGIEQNAQMLGDGGTAHGEVSGDVGHGTLVVGKQIQHLAARLMTDSEKHIGLATGRRKHPFNIRKQ